jgi:hypothetical protein
MKRKPLTGNVKRAALLCAVAALSAMLAAADVYPASRYYTLAGAGLAHRDSFRQDPPYHTMLLSPWIEVGGHITRADTLGFDTRFYLDPSNTSRISSIMLGGRYRCFLVPKTFYVGAGAGFHIESEYVRSEDSEGDTISLDKSKLLFTMSAHAGALLEVTDMYYFVFEVSVTQSAPDYWPYSAGAAVGLMSYF